MMETVTLEYDDYKALSDERDELSRKCQKLQKEVERLEEENKRLDHKCKLVKHLWFKTMHRVHELEKAMKTEN